MRVLFDNGTPRGLARYLAGHTVEEARHHGWEELENGDLIEAAEKAGFDVLVTTDKNIRYQQNLSDRQIALVVLERSHWPMVKLVAAAIESTVDSASPGSYTEVPVPAFISHDPEARPDRNMDQTARITRYLASLDASTNFWLTHSLDREHGGYFTCLTREGQVYDTRKYVWLMGRAVWMFSRLYREREARPEYLEAAKLNLEFLRRYARREDGAYYFALSRDGSPAAFQRKPYGAVFVCIGLAEYARATGEQQYLDEAVELFWKIRQWIADPALLGRARHGQSQLADVMVTISMLQELMPSHDDPRYAELLNQMLDEALAHQHPELGVLTENILADGLRRDESLPGGRLWCPGHSAEVSWFLLRILDEYPDAAKKARVLDNLERSLELGWDTEQEGLYYFLDTQGLPMLELEWDMKLWWPHTEAMLALAHAWRRTGDTKWLGWLDRMDDYSWRTFVDDPGAPSKAVPGSPSGEWFGYTDRSGRITHNAKGNHYKGFFHVPRALWLAVGELRAD